MLKAQKRLTKKQIKEDKFVTLYFQVQDYLSQNSRSILSGAGIIVIIIVAVFIFMQKQQKSEQAAAVELTKARVEYRARNYDGATTLLQNLIQTHGGTDSASEGTFYLGNISFIKKDYDAAEAHYRSCTGKLSDDVLESSALAGIAASQEQRGDFLGAAKTYRRAAQDYADGFLAPLNLYNAARCFILAQDQTTARTLLEELLQEYENSSVTLDAEVLLAELLS
jgi:TolA-binding protein